MDQQISDVRTQGPFISLFNAAGTHYLTLNGELAGFSSEIVVVKEGAWFSIFNSSGTKLCSLPATNRHVHAVIGATVMLEDDVWVYVYDKTGALHETRNR